MENKSKKNIRLFLFTILTFIIMSILSSILLLKSNFVGYGWDMYFHLSRIWDIRESILNGNGLPLVALNKFHQSGSGALSLYPSFNLIPIVVMSFFVKSFVHLIYITFILRNFLSLIISFYACYSFNKNRYISFIFSSVYTLSTMTLWYAFYGMDMGVTSSMIYLPLVLFGALHLLKNNKWKQLSFGISFIILCHIITAVLSVVFVATLLIINYKKFKERIFIVNLLKIFSIVTIITSFFWVQFLLLVIQNHISMPVAIFNLYGEDFTNLLNSVFNNQITEFISLPAFIGIVVSIISYKKMGKLNRQLFFVSIAIIIVASQFFPWELLNGTFIKTTFQRSWRVYPFAQVILCYLFSDGIVLLCHNKKEKIITTISVVLATICIQIVGQKNVINNFNHQGYDISHVQKDDGLLFSDYWQKDFINVDNMYQFVNNREATYDNGKVIKLNLDGNGKYSFVLNDKVKVLHMPFMIYSSIKYYIRVDNKYMDISSSNKHQLIIKNLSKGHHNIQIFVYKSWYNYASYLISIFGIVLMLFLWFKKIIQDNKKR